MMHSQTQIKRKRDRLGMQHVYTDLICTRREMMIT